MEQLKEIIEQTSKIKKDMVELRDAIFKFDDEIINDSLCWDLLKNLDAAYDLMAITKEKIKELEEKQ